MSIFKLFKREKPVKEQVVSVTDYTPLLGLISTDLPYKVCYGAFNEGGIKVVVNINPYFTRAFEDFNSHYINRSLISHIIKIAYKEIVGLLPLEIEYDEVLEFMPSEEMQGYTSEGVYLYIKDGRIWMEATYRIVEVLDWEG